MIEKIKNEVFAINPQTICSKKQFHLRKAKGQVIYIYKLYIFLLFKESTVQSSTPISYNINKISKPTCYDPFLYSWLLYFASQGIGIRHIKMYKHNSNYSRYRVLKRIQGYNNIKVGKRKDITLV